MVSMQKPVAVFAGTPVDTKMGAEVLEKHGLVPVMYPVSRDPMEQTVFQVRSLEEKHETLRHMLQDAKERGCDSAFVYCNSLAGAVRFPVLAAETGMKIVTPMDVYGELARQYGKVAVIAANAQALAGQESVMVNANPDLFFLTADMIPVVLDIEAGIEPAEIVRRNHLDTLMKYFELNGCEALLLGCTHFPYLREALAACTALPIIDPAEKMIEMLTAK